MERPTEMPAKPRVLAPISSRKVNATLAVAKITVPGGWITRVTIRATLSVALMMTNLVPKNSPCVTRDHLDRTTVLLSLLIQIATPHLMASLLAAQDLREQTALKPSLTARFPRRRSSLGVTEVRYTLAPGCSVTHK